MAIKSRLKVLLAMHDMTQTELAQRTGIRPSTLSAICRNKIHSMPVRVIDRICKALDCQPGDFMEYYPDPEPETEMETGSRMVPEKG